MLKCHSYCQYEHTFESSKTGPCKPYDINTRSVYASQTMGLNGLTDFCAKMGFTQPVTQKPFEKITRSLSATSTEVTEDYEGIQRDSIPHVF